MAIALVRKTVGNKLVAEAWSQALDTPVISRKGCPVCLWDMAEVTVMAGETPLVLDLCRRCEFMWFDATEYEAIPPPPPKPRALGDVDESQLPQESRTALAMQRVQDMRENQPPEVEDDVGWGWKTMPVVLGLPVEIDANPLGRTAWSTYLLSALIVGVSVWSFCQPDLQAIVDAYGLIPSQAWRMHGLTFLTSFFLHAGFYHLLGNMYFLLIFGRHAEDFLGHWRWLLLIFAAAFVGDLLHVFADPRADLPCIGASGGISGLITFYALKFPYAKLGYLFSFNLVYFRWVRFPAWVAFLLLGAFQLVGAFEQMAGWSSVSSLAHLGGVAVGVCAWAIWRDIDLKPTRGALPVTVVR
jgi:membrane associated rhomboid family serine protease/Zn-finger nucleic acid-binding protein